MQLTTMYDLVLSQQNKNIFCKALACVMYPHITEYELKCAYNINTRDNCPRNNF